MKPGCVRTCWSGMGACLFTVLSYAAFPGGDPSRVASQILPGIGFLGAGTILKGRRNIHGLTTAASIWITAAVGMAVGVGAWFLALCGTLLIWFVLVILRRIERSKRNRVDPPNTAPVRPAMNQRRIVMLRLQPVQLLEQREQRA